MRRQELAHILGASCRVAHDSDVLVIGSQAILGAFDDDELPDLVRLSREADIAFLDDPTREKADAVEGAIGEMSAFHDANRIYAEGVHIDTAELPEGWRGRLIGWDLRSSDPAVMGPVAVNSWRIRPCSSTTASRSSWTGGPALQALPFIL